MKNVKILLALLLVTVVILVINVGIDDEIVKAKAVERAPVIPSKVQASNADAAPETDLLLNIEQDLAMAEEQPLVSVQHLLDEGLDISPFDENEILVLRKFLTNNTVSDEDISTWFRVFAQIVLLQGGEKNPKGMLSEKVDNNWIGGNAYNHEIQHWENISADGDVIATGVLASFYRNIGKLSKTEHYYQKLLVNVANKSSTLDFLIRNADMQNEKRAAAYAWYGKNNDIDLSRRNAIRFDELINKYNEQAIASELEEVNLIFESLQVNYANSELTNLKDIF